MCFYLQGSIIWEKNISSPWKVWPTKENSKRQFGISLDMQGSSGINWADCAYYVKESKELEEMLCIPLHKKGKLMSIFWSPRIAFGAALEGGGGECDKSGQSGVKTHNMQEYLHSQYLMLY